MNILPKKNWHVLKKENIDRVRRDEARAAEEEKTRLRRIALAEKEARTELLRDRARERMGIVGLKNADAIEAGSSRETKDEPSLALPASVSRVPETSSLALSNPEPRTHINFFRESEAGAVEEKANKERELEEKQEQEKWERKVGILMALGQTPSGPLDNQLNPWWMQARAKNEDVESKTAADDTPKDKKKKLLSHAEKYDKDVQKMEQRRKRDEKRKRDMDPMAAVEKQLSKKRKKDKRGYHDEEDDRKRRKMAKLEKLQKKAKKEEKKRTKSMDELRAERLKRESKERSKALDFLAGKSEKKETKRKEDKNEDKGYFNAQFFPELARKRKN